MALELMGILTQINNKTDKQVLFISDYTNWYNLIARTTGTNTIGAGTFTLPGGYSKWINILLMSGGGGGGGGGGIQGATAGTAGSTGGSTSITIRGNTYNIPGGGGGGTGSGGGDPGLGGISINNFYFSSLSLTNNDYIKNLQLNNIVVSQAGGTGGSNLSISSTGPGGLGSYTVPFSSRSYLGGAGCFGLTGINSTAHIGGRTFPIIGSSGGGGNGFNAAGAWNDPTGYGLGGMGAVYYGGGGGGGGGGYDGDIANIASGGGGGAGGTIVFLDFQYISTGTFTYTIGGGGTGGNGQWGTTAPGAGGAGGNNSTGSNGNNGTYYSLGNTNASGGGGGGGSGGLLIVYGFKGN